MNQATRLHLAHPALADPEYYVPGLPADWVTERYGIPANEIAKLGSAENPLGPSPMAMEAICDAVGHIHLYPSWTAEPLRQKLAARPSATTGTTSSVDQARPR